MRPTGEIRQALRECLRPDGAAVTWRDAAARLAESGVINLGAPSEVLLVRRTMENMVQHGEARPVAAVRAPGSRRPMTAYAGNWVTNWVQGGSAASGGALASVMTGWR